MDAGVSDHSANPLDRVPPVDEAKLVCRVGDLLQTTDSFTLDSGDVAQLGATYRVTGRVYYGWDLELATGVGPRTVRVLNSSVLNHFRIVPQAETP